jgi:hypothetical protein
MEYLDSAGKHLREGLYRDRRDKTCVFYLFQEGDIWKFQNSDSLTSSKFPITMTREIEPIDNPVKELENFRKIINFLERKLDEEVEIRRGW